MASAWGAWLNTIVKQSEDLLTGISANVGEFVESVALDASEQVAELERRLEQGTIIEGVADGLRSLLRDESTDTEPLDGDADEQNIRRPSSAARSDLDASFLVDRKQAALNALRRDPNSYCVELPNESSLLSSFDHASQADRIASSLAALPELRAMHATLVPGAVADNIFWLRYLTRLDAIEQEESKRRLILSHSMRLDADAHADDDTAEAWDMDDDAEAEIPSLPHDEQQQAELPKDQQQAQAELPEEPQEEQLPSSPIPSNEVVPPAMAPRVVSPVASPPTSMLVAGGALVNDVVREAPAPSPAVTMLSPTQESSRRASSEMSFEVVSGMTTGTPVHVALDAENENEADLSRLLRDAVGPLAANDATQRAKAYLNSQLQGDDDDGWAEWE